MRLDKVFIIMFHSEIFDGIFYTDETVVASRVENLNRLANGGYLYKTLSRSNRL